MIVQKFGGSCLDSSEDLRRMAGIIKSSETHGPKVVLSALKGVTDELIHLTNSARAGTFDLGEIEAKHLGLLRSLPPNIRSGTAPQVEQLFDELHHKLEESSDKRLLSPEASDDILAYGEKLAISVASGYLSEAGLECNPVFGAEAGIVTDGVFGNARILEESRAVARERLSALEIPLIAGFFGEDEAGRVTILGRGASDYVAVFIGAALGCRVVLFKDVDGVMTADPKVVPWARIIPRLGYQSALEMAMYGSRILFEKAIIEASRAHIQVEVRSFEKLNEGTIVSGNGEVEAISYIGSLSLVSVRQQCGIGAASPLLARLDGALRSNPPVFASVFRNGLVIAIGNSQVDEVTRSVPPAGNQDIAVRKDVALVAIIGRRFRVSEVVETLEASRLESLGVFKTPPGITTCALVDSSATEAAVRSLSRLLEN